MITELLRMSIIKSLRLPEGYEMIINVGQHYSGFGQEFGLFKDKKLVAEKCFDFNPYTDLRAEVDKIKLWIKPILNPNEKMFSHVKF